MAFASCIDLTINSLFCNPSPKLYTKNFLHFRQNSLVRHGLAILILLYHLRLCIDALRQLRLAHLLLQPRLLNRLPHFRRHPVPGHRFRLIVQLPHVHRRRRFLVRTGIKFFDGLYHCARPECLVHRLWVAKVLYFRLGLSEHHRLPVLRYRPCCSTGHVLR
uniref:Uncharacterized protein n=1 Tax=Rhizophora mucronata TaxID=61149 RepID=A0A2P2IN56_RHIMU